MSEKYKFKSDRHPYFVTLTVESWIDVFTRLNHKLLIIESLEYCIKEKGLIVYAYCLMSNHLHMIIGCESGAWYSDIIRDFKKFTSKQIIKQIKEEVDSRRL